LKKEYIVKSIRGRGKGLPGANDFIKNSEALTSFSYPWEQKEVYGLEFRAFCDDENLYFRYCVETMGYILLNGVTTKRDILKEDRVEIFFTNDPAIKIYFTLEIDALGRAFCAKGVYYRKTDYSWEMDGLLTRGDLLPKGYSVTGSIKIKSLNDLGISFTKQGDRMITGLYRADFSKNDKGETLERWISWVKPESDKPDFHIPSSFGIFIRG